MKLRSGLIALAVVVCGLVAGTGQAGAIGAASTTEPYCGITWGSGTKSAGALSTGNLLTTRTGQHDCYDRLVFEFNGVANGFVVSYGETYTQGEGVALSPYTAGGALLNVTLMAPAHNDDYTVTYPYRTGDHVVNVMRYRTLRDAVFGGSHEGYTTFAVGVRARLPFRVFVLSGPDTHSRIVLDVAHYW